MHLRTPRPSPELIGAIVKIGSTRLWRSAILNLLEYVMPSTRMETRAGWINGRQRDIVEAVQRALVEGIAIPETDRCVRLIEYPEDSFIAPPDRGPAYSVIEISMFRGRSVAAKARLYAALQRELSAFGLGANDLKVIIHDEPFENWGLRGAPADPAKLTFNVNV
jgi:phenylpyruvate tautomerase PptA (4-oxalocrotonate tautomerase family)